MGPRLFQGNLGWWNIIIWPEQCRYMVILRGFPYNSALFGLVMTPGVNRWFRCFRWFLALRCCFFSYFTVLQRSKFRWLNQWRTRKPSHFSNLLGLARGVVYGCLESQVLNLFFQYNLVSPTLIKHPDEWRLLGKLWWVADGTDTGGDSSIFGVSFCSFLILSASG